MLLFMLKGVLPNLSLNSLLCCGAGYEAKDACFIR